MTHNFSLTSAYAQCHLIQLPRVLQNASIFCLDPGAARALFSTCKYFREFSQNGEMQGSLLALHFPLFKPVDNPNRDPVFSSQFSYQKLIAASSRKPGVVLSSSLTHPLANKGFNTHFQFTPDGTKLLIAVWNVDRRIEIGLCEPCGGKFLWKEAFLERVECNNLMITPDGKKVFLSLSHNDRDTLKIIDFETGKTLRDLVTHRLFFQQLQISPDGKSFYTGSKYGSVKWWDLATENCVKAVDIPQVKERCRLQQISQDGRRAISSFENGNLLFWNLETSQPIHILEGHPLQKNFDNICIPMAISFDNTTAVSCRENEVRVWDLKTGFCRIKFPAENTEFTKMVVTPDMKRAALGCRNGELILLDLERGLCQQRFAAHTKKIDSLQITPDGTRVFSGADGEIKWWRFSMLPEERLTQLAENCHLSPAGGNEGLASLPKFAQEEIRAIHSTGLTFEESVNIFNAKVALPNLRGFLEQAVREPERAPMLVSDAVARINRLPSSIVEAVYRHFRNIQLEKGRPWEKVIKTPDLLTALTIDGSLIQDGIEAINRTIKEFRAKVPAANECQHSGN